MLFTSDMRYNFLEKLTDRSFVTDKSGVKTIEIVGSSFTIPHVGYDEDKIIFGEQNLEYVQRELQWYESQSLYVKDIPGKVPEIWEKVASHDGTINSNYGFLIWSYENYHQYANVFEELKKNPDSRRAIMIYTRPSMHYDYNRDGMSDFVCTNTVQYLIRDEELIAIVNMRSNDAILGFRNDFFWQKHVQQKLAKELNVPVGDIIWQTGSIHMYERHFFYVDHFAKTGYVSIKKKDYDNMYPNSEWKSKVELSSN